ncbi:RES domain protein [bacterium BMS3Bbin12]|nr:RES domain protein [bacterium BMS3Bbin12]GBE51146.1 RES domain protein [bacterium BMS3Bbin13]
MQIAQQHARHIPLVYFRIELPETVPIEALRPQDLPESWNAYPYPESMQDLGTGWIRRGEALALYVPSAVVPTERNVILNPAHREFHKLRISTPQPFSLDERLP